MLRVKPIQISMIIRLIISKALFYGEFNFSEAMFPVSLSPFAIHSSCNTFPSTTFMGTWLHCRKSITFTRCNHTNAKILFMIYAIIYCSGRHRHLLRNISNRYCHTSFWLILQGLPGRLKVHGKRPNVTKEIQSYYAVDNPPQNFGIACCYRYIRCFVFAATKHNVTM